MEENKGRNDTLRKSKVNIVIKKWGETERNPQTQTGQMDLDQNS